MDIRYYSYTEEIIDNIKPGTVHIFDKNTDKNIAKERYSGDIFDKQPLFLSVGEFKGSLFLSDKITLKEEKQVIAFYKALSDEHRRKLKVEGYYDVIDIAANFLNFFKMLNEHRIERIEGLKEWQEGIYELFLSIKENYLKLLDKKGYTDPTFIAVDENLDTDVYREYREMIIYNKMYFSPKEKWIMEKLEEAGYEITLKLQVAEGDFDKDSLQLKKVSYIEDETRKISVYRAEDEFTTLLKVLETADDMEESRERYSIYDGNNDNYKYNNFFNESVTLSDIPLFSLVEAIHTLISGAVVEKIISHPTREHLEENLLISIGTMVEVVQNENFNKKYKLKRQDIQKIKEIAGDGYKYITYSHLKKLSEDKEEGESKWGLSVTSEQAKPILLIISDIIKWYLFDNVKSWCRELSFDKEVMLQFTTPNSKESDKYFEALSEVEIIEELDLIEGIVSKDDKGQEVIKKDWANFFGNNVSEGLLRLIMKYHRFKEVTSSRHKLNKSNLDEIATRLEKNRIFMNISDIFVPKGADNLFLLTETQRKDLGIKNSDDIRLLEKYNLLRAIMTSEKVTVIGIENQGQNSSLSPFIEEILSSDSGAVSNRLSLDVESYERLVKDTIDEKESTQITGDDEITLDIDEILEKKKISAYMCGELFNCRYKMYLRYIKNIGNEEVEVEEGLTRREYGNLAHAIFEEVLLKYVTTNYSPLEGGDIDEKKIMDIIERLVKEPTRRLKLPILNDRYYKEILYVSLAGSVRQFFKDMSILLRGAKIERIYIEKSETREIVEGLYQSARADLIVEAAGEKHIIDFKTGSKNDRQLDYYGILYTGEADGAKKYVYNIDKTNLEHENEKVKMSRTELEDEVADLLRSKTYDRRISSSCNRCEYADICLLKDTGNREEV